MGGSNRCKFCVGIDRIFDVEQPVARIRTGCSADRIDKEAECSSKVGGTKLESVVNTHSCLHDIQCGASCWYSNVGHIGRR